jgi:hypothetical protein
METLQLASNGRTGAVAARKGVLERVRRKFCPKTDGEVCEVISMVFFCVSFALRREKRRGW